MAIRYNLWIDPDNTAQHRAVEADLERYFMERFADYPHIRLFGADPYDYDAPFNRLYDALMGVLDALGLGRIDGEAQMPHPLDHGKAKALHGDLAAVAHVVEHDDRAPRHAFAQALGMRDGDGVKGVHLFDDRVDPAVKSLHLGSGAREPRARRFFKRVKALFQRIHRSKQRLSFVFH